MTKRRIIVFGATSGIAEHCMRLWLHETAELLLVGRNEVKLQSLASDLKVRSPASLITTACIDFLDPQAFVDVVEGFAAGEGIDLALIAHGSLPDQEICQKDLDALATAHQLNCLSPILCAEALAAAMERARRGCLAIIGSVAGDRGRRSNYAYGSAKGALERYAQGLQHRFAGSDIKVCLIKPGPTATAMTDHLGGGGLPLAPVEDVATVIVAGVEKRKAVIYAPRRWALIMLVIRHLPRFVFNRLDI